MRPNVARVVLWSLLTALSGSSYAERPKPPVTAVAFDPVERRMAVGTYRECLLVDLAADAPPTRLAGHAEAVRGLSFSPDGRLLASGSGLPARYGEVKIWNLNDHSEYRTIRGHKDSVYEVAFSPDGNLLASGGYEGVAKLWNVASGNQIHALEGHSGAVLSLDFSPDGRFLATAAADEVKIWSVETGQAQHTLAGATDQLTTVAYHPSGEMIAAGGMDDFIRVWKIAGDDPHIEWKSVLAHRGGVLSVVFSRDGKRLISSGAERVVKIWTTETLTLSGKLETAPDWAPRLAVNPSTGHLAVGRYGGSIDLYALPEEGSPSLHKHYGLFGDQQTVLSE